MSLILNKTEAVRYEVEIPEELNKYYKDKVFPFLRKFSKLVHRWLVEGRLQGINDKQFLFSDDTPDMYGTEKGKLPEHRSLDDGRIKLVPEVKAIIDKFFPSDKQEIWGTGVCSLIYQVMNRYSGFHQRNKENRTKEQKKQKVFCVPKNYPNFAPKATAWKCKTFNPKPDEGVIDVRALEGKYKDIINFSVPISKDVYENSELLARDKKGNLIKRGGNIIFKKGEIVLPIHRQFPIEPVDMFLAYDANKNVKSWLAVPYDNKDGVKLMYRPDNILECEKKVQKYTELMNGEEYKKEYNHSQRQGFRKKWDKAHKQYERLIEEFITPHLYHYLETYGRHGWGIDCVKTGDKNGTFGQDKLPKIISRFCFKHKLPFYYVSTFYTSQRCSSCGNVDKNARDKDTNIYECTSPLCDYREQADINAAINIAIFAAAMHDAEHQMFMNQPSKNSREANAISGFLNNYFALR
jgi:hypothetical protein